MQANWLRMTCNGLRHLSVLNLRIRNNILKSEINSITKYYKLKRGFICIREQHQEQKYIKEKNIDKRRGSIAHRNSRHPTVRQAVLPYGEDVTMKNDVYIVRIIIIVRFVGHKRGCRSNHSHRQHKKAQTRSRRSDKPPGARHPYPYRNAKFVLCLTQDKFGLLSYAVMQINNTAIQNVGCRDPPNQSF